MNRRCLAAIACAVLLTAGAVATSRAAQRPQRVLFIGNSLTSANNLPGLVEALSRAAGESRIECRLVAFPNYSLEDHWNRGDAPHAIAEGAWSIVVLQQGPSALPESRVLLIEYVRRFDAAIRKAGARTALYMVWPAAARRGDFDGVSASYSAAARAVNGLLLPVGDAWRAAWRRDPRIELYGPDGFHPTALASYLGALVIYQELSGRSPVGLPSTMLAPALRDARILILQQAAADANAAASK